MRTFCKLILFLCLLWVNCRSFPANAYADLIQIDGPIGPVTQEYFHRSLNKAVKQQAKVIVLAIDTPGGLSDSMRGIVQDILSSPIPVLGFVFPSGARAASAGAYILYACHVAAMAPGTNLGAASPVEISGENQSENNQKKPMSTEELKAFHDAQAYIRSLAELRHRNAEWAELAVSQAASISAQQALQKNVIDLIANNPQDLLSKVDGRKVIIGNQVTTLQTQNLIIHKLLPDWRTRLLAVITQPSIAYILMILGIYGLFFELMNPGFILPGVAGAIALLLALYAFQLLPINYVGFSLTLLGLGFIIAEIFVPAYGSLGIGGAIAFLIGSLMLFKKDSTFFHLSLGLIIGVTVISLLFFLGVIGMAVRARRRPIITGREGMINQVGIVVIDRGVTWIYVAGERWQALNDQSLKNGQQVKVIGIKGLKLIVQVLS